MLVRFGAFHQKRSNVGQSARSALDKDAEAYSHSIKGRLGKKANKSSCPVGLLARRNAYTLSNS